MVLGVSGACEGGGMGSYVLVVVVVSKDGRGEGEQEPQQHPRHVGGYRSKHLPGQLITSLDGAAAA